MSTPSQKPSDPTPAPSPEHQSGFSLPPLHGINIPSDPAIPQGYPFVVEPAVPFPVATDGLPAKMFAGGSACVIISALTNPMDVIKIRLQLQKKAVDATVNPKYPGMISGLFVIAREEGVRGLMRGVGPSMFREATYSSVRLGLYDYFKAIIAPNTAKKDFQLWHKVAAGVASGTIGSFATPIDRVKILFQSYDVIKPNPYPSMWHALADLGRSGGVRELYKGLIITTTRASVLTAAQLSSYDHSKTLLIRSAYFKDNFVTHTLASIIAGFVTTTAANPFDVVKTRIMSEFKDGPPKYSSTLDCFWKTLRNEGVLAFGKGWFPNYLRLGPHSMLSLPLAEFIRIQLGTTTI